MMQKGGFVKTILSSALIILCFGCSDKNDERGNTSAVEKRDKNSETIASKVRPASFDDAFKSFFADSDFKVEEKKNRVGDCASSLKKFKKQDSDVSVVLDNLFCGEYSSIRKRILLRNNDVFAASIQKSDWSGTPGVYTLTETFYYFGNEDVVLFSRVDAKGGYQDSVIVRDIPFIEKVVPGDSVLSIIKYEYSL